MNWRFEGFALRHVNKRAILEKSRVQRSEGIVVAESVPSEVFFEGLPPPAAVFTVDIVGPDQKPCHMTEYGRKWAAWDRLGATRATLEVRRSNEPARVLYERFGFSVAGIRRAYYTKPVEDAIILWREGLGTIPSG